MILTKNVIFNKKSYFNSKRESLTDTLIREKDELIKRAIMLEKLAANESIIQDNDLISLYNNKNENTIVIDIRHLEIGQDSYNFVYNSLNWPTLPQSNPDNQNNT
jgi:hypothetical protein